MPYEYLIAAAFVAAGAIWAFRKGGGSSGGMGTGGVRGPNDTDSVWPGARGHNARGTHGDR